MYSKNIIQTSTSENMKKMYNLKNVTYKGSCLPVRVLLPRNFLMSLILSGGLGGLGFEKILLKSLFSRK